MHDDCASNLSPEMSQQLWHLYGCKMQYMIIAQIGCASADYTRAINESRDGDLYYDLASATWLMTSLGCVVGR